MHSNLISHHKRIRTTMLAIIYYIILGIACTIVLILSAITLVVLYPFDPARRCIHEQSRLLTRLFFCWPKWRKIVRGVEKIDRKQAYVITINHTSMVDIPLLYRIPLNFRWVSKREVFRIPFFGQMLTLHGDICIDRSSSGAMSKVTTLGKKWIGRGASVAIFPEGHARKMERFIASNREHSRWRRRRECRFCPLYFTARIHCSETAGECLGNTHSELMYSILFPQRWLPRWS